MIYSTPKLFEVNLALRTVGLVFGFQTGANGKIRIGGLLISTAIDENSGAYTMTKYPDSGHVDISGDSEYDSTNHLIELTVVDSWGSFSKINKFVSLEYNENSATTINPQSYEPGKQWRRKWNVRNLFAENPTEDELSTTLSGLNKASLETQLSAAEEVLFDVRWQLRQQYPVVKEYHPRSGRYDIEDEYKVKFSNFQQILLNPWSHPLTNHNYLAIMDVWPSSAEMDKEMASKMESVGQTSVISAWTFPFGFFTRDTQVYGVNNTNEYSINTTNDSPLYNLSDDLYCPANLLVGPKTKSSLPQFNLVDQSYTPDASDNDNSCELYLKDPTSVTSDNISTILSATKVQSHVQALALGDNTFGIFYQNTPLSSYSKCHAFNCSDPNSVTGSKIKGSKLVYNGPGKYEGPIIRPHCYKQRPSNYWLDNDALIDKMKKWVSDNLPEDIHAMASQALESYPPSSWLSCTIKTTPVVYKKDYSVDSSTWLEIGSCNLSSNYWTLISTLQSGITGSSDDNNFKATTNSQWRFCINDHITTLDQEQKVQKFFVDQSEFDTLSNTCKYTHPCSTEDDEYNGKIKLMYWGNSAESS